MELLKCYWNSSSSSSCLILHSMLWHWTDKKKKKEAVSSPRVLFSVLKVFPFYVIDDPAVLILLLEQGDHSLEDHTKDFVFLANLTHYPDNCLCSFYQAGLAAATRAQLSGDSSRDSLAAFIDWVLVSCTPTIVLTCSIFPHPVLSTLPCVCDLSGFYPSWNY